MSAARTIIESRRAECDEVHETGEECDALHANRKRGKP
jgi:hypothetical protein